MKMIFRLLITLLITVVLSNTSCKPTDFSADINALKASRDSLAAALKVTNANLQTTNNTLASLGTSITTIQAQLVVISGQTATLNTKLDALALTLAGNISSVLTIQSQIKTIQDQIAVLNSQQTATSATVSNLGTTITSIQTQLTTVLGQVATLNSQQITTNVSLKDIYTKLTLSNSQLSSLSLQFNALLTQLGLVLDVDGNFYHTVTIGAQVWMAENLKTTKFRNGDAIPYWTKTASRGYCWYNDDVNNKSTYGAIYQYYTAMDSRSICPLGWHIPNDTEWAILINYLGGENVAGGKVKESGTTHWASPNIGATNETGFAALPGGSRDCSNVYGGIGNGTSWIGSTPAVGGWYHGYYVDSTNAKFLQGFGFDCNASYVRCVKD